MIKRKPIKGEDTVAEQGTSSLGYYGESVMLSIEILRGIWDTSATTTADNFALMWHLTRSRSASQDHWQIHSIDHQKLSDTDLDLSTCLQTEASSTQCHRFMAPIAHVNHFPFPSIID